MDGCLSVWYREKIKLAMGGGNGLSSNAQCEESLTICLQANVSRLQKKLLRKNFYSIKVSLAFILILHRKAQLYTKLNTSVMMQCLWRSGWLLSTRASLRDLRCETYRSAASGGSWDKPRASLHEKKPGGSMICTLSWFRIPLKNLYCACIKG